MTKILFLLMVNGKKKKIIIEVEYFDRIIYSSWRNILLKKVFLGLKINPKTIVLWVLLCIITLGIAIIIANIIDFLRGIFNIEGTKKNRAMMRAVAVEIEKLVNK